MTRITALIPAFNAEQTVARAIVSCRKQVDEVLVVNDGSEDNTAAVVQQCNTGNVRLINLPKNSGIGRARQVCLENCTTDYAAWLDADDLFLPNRIESMTPWLNRGYDLVYDNMELFDGTTGRYCRRSEIPDFLKTPSGLDNQFARNHIRGIGVPLVKVHEARKIGYNGYRHAEDFDFFLRSLLAGLTVKLHEGTSYRQYIYPCSLSNSTANLASYQRQVLEDIGFTNLQQYLAQSALSDNDIWKICLFFLANTHNWELLFNTCDRDQSTENKEAQWLALFMRGVALIHTGDYKSATQALEAANHLRESAEAFNNLAVCRFYLSKNYKCHLRKALQLKPDYSDASNNLLCHPKHITNVPLRSLNL